MYLERLYYSPHGRYGGVAITWCYPGSQHKKINKYNKNNNNK